MGWQRSGQTACPFVRPAQAATQQKQQQQEVGRLRMHRRPCTTPARKRQLVDDQLGHRGCIAAIGAVIRSIFV